VFTILILGSTILYSQSIKLDKNNLQPVNVTLSLEKLDGKETVKILEDTTVKGPNKPTFVKIKNVDFHNGTIEVDVLSRLGKNAGEFARGFIGIAFRINDDNSKFEGIYIRPTNGRADDQLRRNHSTQYFSYPDFDFDRLRKESPGQYESYADMGLGEWIKMKIEVRDPQARLFLNNSKQPVLIVNDLKLGGDNSGAIGFWLGSGTEGYFSDLKITKN
jgi:hypothetical protein